MGNTVSRIKEYIDYKGISVRKFEESVGFSNGSFASQFKNNKTIGVDKVEYILHVYADIDPVWLLTGVGQMLKSATEPITTHSLPISTEDKLLKIIADKDKEIKVQAKEIGRLEQEVEQLKKLEKNSSDDSCEDVRGVGSAVAG